MYSPGLLPGAGPAVTRKPDPAEMLGEPLKPTAGRQPGIEVCLAVQ